MESGSAVGESAHVDEEEGEQEFTEDGDSGPGTEDFADEDGRGMDVGMKIAISSDLAKRMTMDSGTRELLQNPHINAIMSGNIQVLEFMITQGLSCPLKDLRISYALAAGYHDETAALVMLKRMQSAAKACMGDITQEFAPCQGCRERLRDLTLRSGKGHQFF